METPWHAECRGALDEGATIGDVKHDHDAPCYSPLLSANKTTSLRWWSHFRDVDRNLSTADANGKTIDDSASDQLSDVLCCCGDDTANDPDDCTDHDCLLSAKDIGDVAGAESSEPGTTGHGGGDTTLDIGAWAATATLTLVEVTFVGVSANDGTHRRDIKTEETTANDCDGSNEVVLCEA